MSDTIAAIATPTGEGGISIIRCSGSGALAVAQKIFHTSLKLMIIKKKLMIKLCKKLKSG